MIQIKTKRLVIPSRFDGITSYLTLADVQLESCNKIETPKSDIETHLFPFKKAKARRAKLAVKL